MRMLKHRVAAVVCAAGLSMVFSRTGAAQMAREPEIQLETQAMYHSRTLAATPGGQDRGEASSSGRGCRLGAGILEPRGRPEDGAPRRVGLGSGATGEAADAGGVLGRRPLGMGRRVVYLDPGTLGRAGAAHVGPSRALASRSYSGAARRPASRAA